MPAVVSDIHEISVIIGLLDEKISIKDSIDSKFKTFSFYSQKYGNDKIVISKSEFSKKVELFDRGILLAKDLISKFKLEGNSVRWSGLENHTVDSSDIYSDGFGISLKDSSKIVRNNGFEQLLNTFCKTTLKTFKDPFWEFSPSLSADFIATVINSCYKSGYLSIKSNAIYIENKKVSQYSNDIKNLLRADLKTYSQIFTKANLKKLVKEFSSSGDLDELLKVRTSLVKDVQDKVVAVLKEGLLQNPKYVGDNFKLLLQYTDNPKYFGFSASSMIYSGIIPSSKKVSTTPLKIYTEPSKLTNKTTGLQINLYTDIELDFSKIKNKISLQNQLRYKHRTFSCAPEANLHILSYDDWKKIYPDTITFS